MRNTGKKFSKSELAGLEIEIQTITDENNGLKARLAKVSDELQAKTEQLQKLDNVYDEIKNKDKQIASLHEDLRTTSKKYEDLNEKYIARTDAVESLADLKIKNSQLDSQNQLLKNKIVELEANQPKYNEHDIAGLRLEALKIADETKKAAEAEAERINQAAQAEAKKMISEAANRRDELLAIAETQSDDMIAKAQQEVVDTLATISVKRDILRSEVSNLYQRMQQFSDGTETIFGKFFEENPKEAIDRLLAEE